MQIPRSSLAFVIPSRCDVVQAIRVGWRSEIHRVQEADYLIVMPNRWETVMRITLGVDQIGSRLVDGRIQSRQGDQQRYQPKRTERLQAMLPRHPPEHERRTYGGHHESEQNRETLLLRRFREGSSRCLFRVAGGVVSSSNSPAR